MTQTNILLESGGNELEIIEFYIEEQLPDGKAYCGYYAMNVAKVLEIIRMPEVTSVPSKHDKAVLGTFNLRGRVLPLVDLAKWLGKTTMPNDTHKVIVSEFSGVVTAFLVSGVTRIHRISWSQVEPPGQHVQSYSRDSITGVVRIDEHILFILDMEKIVSSMDSHHANNHFQTDKVEIDEADAHNFHLLVVDDSTSLRHLIKDTLEKAGYNVTTASNGREAWDYLQNLKAQAAQEGVPVTEKLHTVISDIEMPEMDGHTLTKNIRGDSGLQKLPVVLFSSIITDALRHKGQSVGADDQISKPDLPGLTKRMRAVIAAKLGK
ncbi:MAG: chemotaxis protein [Desulfovibrionaceae bacterium]|nr:chemotaxis protein [Desulfovibrionaceae bacterium]